MPSKSLTRRPTSRPGIERPIDQAGLERRGVDQPALELLVSAQGAVAKALGQGQKKAELLGGWQWLYLDTLDWVQTASREGTLTPHGRREAAVTMGIATEKTLLLTGQPTAITAEIHEHWHHFPDLLKKLNQVAQRMGERKVIETTAIVAPAAGPE